MLRIELQTKTPNLSFQLSRKHVRNMSYSKNNVMAFYRWEGTDLILFIQVQPRASQTSIVGVHDDRLKLKISAAPVDGKANAEVCKILAKLFGIAKSKIIIQSGHTSRNKSIWIKSPPKLPDFIEKVEVLPLS